ncbi:hypothetical protein CDAR_189691 [Caerostris darwini]|uniref:Uncharacterized protein n=1 Tax=Caerostris darwini TaxID=1538125 RepID=A0AAV4VDH3_9ARAC|nr:hypothetical protein CDAR_189691 [Caerostris darwini]
MLDAIPSRNGWKISRCQKQGVRNMSRCRGAIPGRDALAVLSPETPSKERRAKGQDKKDLGETRHPFPHGRQRRLIQARDCMRFIWTIFQ